MSEQMKHQGIVMATTPDGVHVRIVEAAACADCKAHSICNSSEKKEKFVDVAAPAGRYAVGDWVTVVGTTSMGMRATWLGFGIPLLLMVAGIVVGAQVLANETTGALAGLALLVPYYLILWTFRDRLNREFVFRLEEN